MWGTRLLDFLDIGVGMPQFFTISRTITLLLWLWALLLLPAFFLLMCTPEASSGGSSSDDVMASPVSLDAGIGLEIKGGLGDLGLISAQKATAASLWPAGVNSSAPMTCPTSPVKSLRKSLGLGNYIHSRASDSTSSCQCFQVAVTRSLSLPDATPP